MPTFVFTDIESSTRLWEEHPEGMAEALDLHDSLLGDAIQQSGRVVKTTGDGFIGAFDSAADALAASVDIQLRLAAADWSVGPIRARIGINSGDTEERSGDYFGPTMNRTARIMAAGHGGQILVSGSTAAQISGQLPEELALRDLGYHRLKDLTEPEHLFQVVHPQLESEFSELLTLEARPNNLPRQNTEFLGREQELTAIQAILEADGTRLLTLAGPGGAGKTRLSLQIAAEQVDRFDHGVFFVDLSSERDADAAFEAVVRSLDLSTADQTDPLELLKARLRDRKMLLVLDNFEQLMGAANGVADLTRSCPDIKVLVTSRETLRVRGERVFPVPPMSLPNPTESGERIAESEAVQLFVERARAIQHDFRLTEENSRSVAEICLRLDGLPLAIELAAARLNIFSPPELLSRLTDRLDILGSGGRDLPDRQRTLWGAIAWSYELLDQAEKDVLEMMSVFSPTRLPAIEAVAGDCLDIGLALDAVSSLVDKSLMRAKTTGDATRFSMLLMVREYAAERLAESPERELDVRRSHTAYFSNYVTGLEDRLRGPGRASALEDLTEEIGNLRSAWAFWVEQGDLEKLFGLLDGLWALHEAHGWYRAAIELAKDTLGVLSSTESSSDLAAEELILRTSLARALMAIRGYDEEVEQAFKEALALTEAGSTPAQRFPVLRALASYYTLSGNLEAAASTGQQLLDLGEETGDEAIIIEGHYVVGMAVSFGDLDKSLPHLDKAIEMYDPDKHGSNRFRVGPNTGVVARTASAITLLVAGELTKATERMADGLALARDIDHPFSLAYALYHNGYVFFLRRRYDDCLRCAEQLERVALENEYAIWATLSTVLQGAAAAGLGSPAEGLAKAEAGIDLYRGLTTPPVFWPFLLGLRAVVHAMAGRPREAIDLVDEAVEIGSEGAGSPPGLEILKADFLQMLPDPQLEAIEQMYEQEIDTARQLRLSLIELQGLNRLVALRRTRGKSPDGTSELIAVYERFDEDFDEHDLRTARELLGL